MIDCQRDEKSIFNGPFLEPPSDAHTVSRRCHSPAERDTASCWASTQVCGESRGDGGIIEVHASTGAGQRRGGITMKQSPGPMALAGLQPASCLPPASSLVVTPNSSMIRQVRQPRKGRPIVAQGGGTPQAAPQALGCQTINIRRSSPWPANTPARCRDRKHPLASHSIVGVMPDAA